MSRLVKIGIIFSLLMSSFLFVCAEEEIESTGIIEEVVELSDDITTTVESMMYYNLSDPQVLWIDRFDLPKYADDFYQWLIDNSKENGALIDPTKAASSSTGYYYPIVSVEGEVDFHFIPGNSSSAASEANLAVSNAMKEEFEEVMAVANTAAVAFDRDYPEVFWLQSQRLLGYGGSYSYSGDSTGDGTARYQMDVMFHLVYSPSDFDYRRSEYRDTDKILDAINEMNDDVETILKDGFPSTGTRFEQLSYLNQWLTKHNMYNSEVAFTGESQYKDAWECISALDGRTGEYGPVCEGYARAFMVLCNQLEIPCVLVDGFAKSRPNEESGAHMWNYVQMEDDKWYAVDVTWNDPFVLSGNNTESESGYETDKWLLLGSKTEVEQDFTFIESHPVSNQPSLSIPCFINGPVLSEVSYLESLNHKQKVIFELRQGDEGTLSTYEMDIQSGSTIGNQIPEIEFTSEQLSEGWKLLGYFINDQQVSVEQLKNMEINTDLVVEVRTYVDRIGQGDDGSLEVPDGIDDRLQAQVYFYDGEKLLSSQIVMIGESAVLPANPSKKGYRFSGWDKDSSNITGNLIVYAKYREADDPIYDVVIDGVCHELENVSNKEGRIAVVKLNTDEYGNIPGSKYSVNEYLFAGFYDDVSCTQSHAIRDMSQHSGEFFVKFVTKDVFKIMAQNSVGIKNSPKGKMRLIATVDSLDYAMVGFEIDIEGMGTSERNSSTVYRVLVAKDGQKEIRYVPTMISNESVYFLTMTIAGIPQNFHDAKFTIRAYWDTLDGTRVYGDSYVKVISQMPGYN